MHEAWAREVLEFEGNHDGAVRAVVVEEVEIRRIDGRRQFLPVPGSRSELPADLVLLAAGFVGTDVPELLAALEVDVDPARGTALVDDGWRTSTDGIYSCGDATRGASLVVWAIAEGRACAAAVDGMLAGASDLPTPVMPRALPL